MLEHTDTHARTLEHIDKC